MEAKSKILIIDDDDRNIFALSAVLKARGYRCLAVSDASQGIEMLKNDTDVEVVLLDMMLPEIDGYQALKIIRSDKRLKNMPVVAVTAQAMVGDREKCIAAGADDYVTKPVDIDRLLRILTKFAKK